MLKKCQKLTEKMKKNIVKIIKIMENWLKIDKNGFKVQKID